MTNLQTVPTDLAFMKNMQPTSSMTLFRTIAPWCCILAFLALSLPIPAWSALTEIEPNNFDVEANTLPLKQPMYGQLYSALDQDYFVYNAPNAGPKNIAGYFLCSPNQVPPPQEIFGFVIRVFSPSGLQASYTISESMCTNTFGFSLAVPRPGRYLVAISSPPQSTASNATLGFSDAGYVLSLGSRAVSTGFCPPGKSPVQVPIPATTAVCGRTWLEFCHPTVWQCL